ncbi:zinc finger protein 239-like [Neocloeon triangulifer]|uniref:zinc finger protein 239-like n=1 Tax=Neocloeon triangulifer TaxID=2078957 RepID=UPI00286F6A8F|nr:zinc finger protein 239-like [Neocloeon triangulifer]
MAPNSAQRPPRTSLQSRSSKDSFCLQNQKSYRDSSHTFEERKSLRVENRSGSAEMAGATSGTLFDKSPLVMQDSSGGGGDHRWPQLTPQEAPLDLRLRPAKSGRTLLPCEVCAKTFDRPSLLKRHMRTHTGERPHGCDVCGKRFSTSSSLNTHRRIHSGEKPHACSVCGKRFTASSNLYYHRMTHTKEKPHKCRLCLKSFPTPGDLRSHQYVHSGAWPFRCPACGRGFSKLTNLRNHALLHTGDRPHACPLCAKRFALACNLRAHLKTHAQHHPNPFRIQQEQQQQQHFAMQKMVMEAQLIMAVLQHSDANPT